MSTTVKTVPAPLHPALTGGPEYPFVKLDRRKRELAPAGVTPINFGMGDPREETPEFIRETLKKSVPVVSSYPATAGKAELRAACAAWLGRRYGVTVDPEVHVLPLNGAKEGVFNMAFGMIHPGSAKRTIVIPTPAYPVYEAGALYSGVGRSAPYWFGVAVIVGIMVLGRTVLFAKAVPDAATEPAA